MGAGDFPEQLGTEGQMTMEMKATLTRDSSTNSMDSSHTWLATGCVDLRPAHCSVCSRTTLSLSPPPRHEAPRPRTLSRWHAVLTVGSCAASRTKLSNWTPKIVPSFPNSRHHSQYMLQPTPAIKPQTLPRECTPYEKKKPSCS